MVEFQKQKIHILEKQNKIMQTSLIAILSIIGLFALYWVLFGQAKYNKMIRQTDDLVSNLGKEPGRIEEKKELKR